MKKIFALFLTILVLASASMAFAEEYEDGNPQLSPEIWLKGNPTTGYTWTAEISNEDVVRVISEYYLDETEGLAGAPGKFWFRIDGLVPGDAMVTFRYARSWEETEPLYTLVYRVMVDEELNVMIWDTEMEMTM